MADADSSIDLTTEFLTWHNSNGDVHILTEAGRVLFVSKKKDKMVEQAKKIRRGTKISVRGSVIYSKTLSTHVIDLEELNLA